MRRRNMIKSSAVLALIFCFFSVVGAMAQNPSPNEARPTVHFGNNIPSSHNGLTSFSMRVFFGEPPIGFTADDIKLIPWNFEGLMGGSDPSNFTPIVTRFRQDSENPLRYLFSVTPISKVDDIARYDIQVKIPVGAFIDADGNVNRNHSGIIIGYRKPEGLVVDAGADQVVESGATVYLAGRASLTGKYLWERDDEHPDSTPGKSVTLSNATILDPTFTADTLNVGDNDVVHVLQLTVSDEINPSVTRSNRMRVTVKPPNVAPPVSGANQRPVATINRRVIHVDSGTPVDIDGMGTDSDGTIEDYAWTRTHGTGNNMLSVNIQTMKKDQPGEFSRLSFMADALEADTNVVTHVFKLEVTDNNGEKSDPVDVTVIVTSPSNFTKPSANAGEDQSVSSGTTVSLDGSGSEGDRQTIDYLWTRTGGTPGKSVILTGANTAQPSFTADTLEPEDDDVTHVFTLTVTDDADETDTDTVMVTVTPVLVDILVNPSDLPVKEGDSGTYQVSLSESPRREVSVIAFLDHEFPDHEDVVLEYAPLVFNTENWSTGQEVRIITVADTDKEDDTARIRHRLDGVAFGRAESVTVHVIDIDEDPILRPIGNYLASRATALLNNQPDLIRFLKQDETTQGGNFALKATEGRLAMDGGFVHDGVWGEVTGSYGNSNSGDTNSVLGSFGIHRKYSENLLVGAMLQFDLSDHDLAGNTGRIDGTVWLVGPYFAASYGSQPLYFEGRLLYGESDNNIRFIDRNLGVRTGSFDTTQLLAQIRVEGEIALSDRDEGPRLIPYADARWIEDRAEAFTDRIGNRFVNRVPGQKVSTGQLELGSNVEIPVAVNHGEMTLTGGLGLVYANTEGDYIQSDSRGRGRGEIGFSYGLDANVQIDFESFYDGIGTSQYEGYGLSLSAEMKF